MRWICLLLCCTLARTAAAQSETPGNQVSWSVMAPLNITYRNALELLQPKVIHNALELKLKVKQQDLQVFAHAEVNGGAGAAALANLLALRLVNKTSPNAALSRQQVSLSAVPMPLLQQPRLVYGAKHYSFYYDMVINPSSTIIPPGSYQYSLVLTMTPQ